MADKRRARRRTRGLAGAGAILATALCGTTALIGWADLRLGEFLQARGYSDTPRNWIGNGEGYGFEANRTVVWTTGLITQMRSTRRTNRQGWFADYDYDAPVGPETRPIAALVGDSFVESLEIAWPANCAGQMARALAATHRTHAYGVAGAPLSEYLIMAREALKHGAEDLTFLIIYNDFDESMYPYRHPAFHSWRKTEEGHYVVEDPTPYEGLGIRVDTERLRQSGLGWHLYRNGGGNRLIWKLMGPPYPKEAYRPDQPKDTPLAKSGFVATELFLKEAARIRETHGIHIRLAITMRQPYWDHQMFQPWPERPLERLDIYQNDWLDDMAERGTEEGFEVIDMDAALRAGQRRRGERLDLGPRLGHFAPWAHRLCGTEIARAVQERALKESGR